MALYILFFFYGEAMFFAVVIFFKILEVKAGTIFRKTGVCVCEYRTINRLNKQYKEQIIEEHIVHCSVMYNYEHTHKLAKDVYFSRETK